MNKERRFILNDMVCELEGLINGEQKALDNTPKSFRSSTRFLWMAEGIRSLKSAKGYIEEALDY